MRRKNLIWIAALAAIGAMAAPVPQQKVRPAPAAAPAPSAEEEGVIDPRADEALRKMSTYLAGLQSFRVDAKVVDEKVTTEGQKLQELTQQTLTLQRPGRMRVDRFGPNGHATLRSDGKTVTAFNQDKNVFVTIPVPPTLDATLDELRARLQIDAPGADFLFSDPYKELIDGVLVGRYIGLEPVGDVMAHHLAMTEKDVDWQLWIAAGDRADPAAVRHHHQGPAGTPPVHARAVQLADRSGPGARHLRVDPAGRRRSESSSRRRLTDPSSNDRRPLMTRKLMFLCVMASSALSLGALPAPQPLVTESEGIVGRPLTPVSVAGVARRTTRRAVYATAATHPVYYPPPPTTVVVQPVPVAPPLVHPVPVPVPVAPAYW